MHGGCWSWEGRAECERGWEQREFPFQEQGRSPWQPGEDALSPTKYFGVLDAAGKFPGEPSPEPALLSLRGCGSWRPLPGTFYPPRIRDDAPGAGAA